MLSCAWEAHASITHVQSMVVVLLLHCSCCVVPVILPVSLLSWKSGTHVATGHFASHFLCCVQEEIDEEALPCLSVQDLQSVGITNTAHQRLILSAAMQPATQHVARPDSTAQPSKHCLAHPHVTVCSAKLDGARAASSTNSTTAVLPTRALPVGLNSIAAAVAFRQSTVTSVSANAVNKATALPQSKPVAAVLSSVPSQPRSAAASRVVASAVAPSKIAGVVVRSGKPPSNPVKSAAAALAIKPVSNAAVTVSKTAVATSTSLVVKKAARPAATIAPAKTAIPNAVSATYSAPTANSNQKMAMMLNGSRAVEAQVGTSGWAAAPAAAAAVNRGAAVLAPRSKADEARQLAMALSASVGADTGGPFWAVPCTRLQMQLPELQLVL